MKDERTPHLRRLPAPAASLNERARDLGTVDPSTLVPLVVFDITAEEIVDAMWAAFRRARAGDITAREGQDAVKDYWKVADAAGLAGAVSKTILSRSEAVIRGQQ